MNGTPHTRVQVPPGVQCFVGDEARRRRRIEERVVSVFEGWDYEEIIPPLFDYADVFAGKALGPKTYSFVGRDGSLLALRPDFTSLLAKVAAGRLAHRPPPMRLYYSGEVLRYEPPKAGRQSELYQMGLEHLGGAGRPADVEVLAIAAECLERLDVQGFVLALGHVGVFG
ncbi:MAG TPA: ATP phosphoribosyltransferase regulatory subunit, partial [Vicinamibacteria bacterium]